MQLLITPSQLSETFEDLITCCEKIYFATAWATDKHSIFDTLVDHSEKVELGVVGLHFYQTSPKFIETFMNSEQVFFKKSVSGVFHPKFFLFKFLKNYKVVLGSANFTSGAFKVNEEVSILLELEEGDNLVNELIEKIHDYTHGCERITYEYLDMYKDKYKLQKKLNDTLRSTKTKTKVNQLKEIIPEGIALNMSWLEYKEGVENGLYDGYNKRLELLDVINKLLKKDSFEKLSKDEKKLIAGMITNLPYDSGWFGSLEGAGFMKNVVNEHADLIAKALNKIPDIGNITENHFNEYVELFNLACSGQKKSPQIACYTRFLSVKRPDFFCTY